MKEKLIKAKEKVGKFWDRNGKTILVTGLVIVAYSAGAFIGGKYTMARSEIGIREIMRRYPDTPIKDLEKAAIDTLAAVKAK